MTDVRLLKLPELPPKGDVTDWLEDGHSPDDLRNLIERAPEWTEKRTQAGDVGILLSEVSPESVEWIWRHYVPRGKVVVLDGDPDTNKTTIACDLIARVTSGEPMPDGSVGIAGGAVFLSAEDGLADTLVPRLKAAGADLSQVVALNTVGKGRDRRPVILPDDLDSVRSAIKRVKAVLVVVDPFMAFLSGKVNSFRDQDVRRALAQIAELAEETGATIVIIRHLNKIAGIDPLYRGGGSIGIIGAARAGFLVARHPSNDDLRIIAPIKSNLGPRPRSIVFRVKSVDEIPVIEWLGNTNLTAADLVDSQRAGKPTGHRGVILDELERGTRYFKDVAEAVGMTVANARKTLNRMYDAGEVVRVAPGEYCPAPPPQTITEPFSCSVSPLSPVPVVPIVPKNPNSLGYEDKEDKKDSKDSASLPLDISRWPADPRYRLAELEKQGMKRVAAIAVVRREYEAQS